MTRSRRGCVGMMLVLLVCVAPGAARAQAPAGPPKAATPFKAVSDQDKAKARELWKAGREKSDAGDHAGALAAFVEAEKLVPAPSTTLEVGRELALLGRLVEARDVFLRAANYPLQAGEPVQFGPAREEARALVAETERRIPSIRVVLRTEGGQPLPAAVIAEVAIDGYQLAELRGSKIVDPGKHVIQVRAAGYEPAEQQVEIAEGEQRAVEVALKKAGAARAGPAVAAAPKPGAARPKEGASPPEAEEPEGEGGLPLPLFAIVGLGVGGAGIITGAVTGGLSLAAGGDAEGRCADGLCPDDAQDDLDRARLLAEISNAGFGAGIAGIGLGLVAWLVPGGGGNGDESAGPPPVAWAGIGVGGAGLVAGAITGALSLVAAGDAKDQCPEPARCSPEGMDAEARSRTLAGISTGALAAGVVGAGIGVTALLLGDGAAKTEARAIVGPASLGIEGRF